MRNHRIEESDTIYPSNTNDLIYEVRNEPHNGPGTSLNEPLCHKPELL